MKKQAIINFAVICILSLLPLAIKAADKVISISETLSGNTDVYVFDGEISAGSIRASGIAVFPGFTGYVRILLTDTYGLDYLVYESTPLVSTDGRDSFTDKSEETPDVSQITSTKIRVEISNASLDSLTVTISDQAMQLRSSTEKEQLQMERINKVNTNLERMNALWRAGNTEVSRLSYEDKKSLFGGQLPDLGGFEYYVGGVFEIDPSYSLSNNTSLSESEELYVKEFDWRKRHGADKPSSPYYNSGGSGWMTPVQSQNCGSCWAFAAVGALEAAANVYFNRYDSVGKSLLNLDLSEQEILACSRENGCKGGWAYIAYDYIQTYGVGDEESLPVARPGRDDNCGDKTTRKYTVKIQGYTDMVEPKSESELKRLILDSSPCYMSVSAWHHALVVAGYRILSEGDSLRIRFEQNYQITSSNIVLQAGDPRIGRTVIIIKNSWDTGWGENGYGYFLAANTHLWFTPINFPVTVTGSMNLSGNDVMCEDRDGDGYYFWGTGPKPAHCPECPNEPDSDDSDPDIGPMNLFGKAIPAIYGKANVTQDELHVYSYVLPIKATADTYIPVRLNNTNGDLNTQQLYIPKGYTSANFTVSWAIRTGTDNKIIAGDVEKDIVIDPAYSPDPTQNLVAPSVTSLLEPGYKVLSKEGNTEYWYIPYKDYGNLLLAALDEVGGSNTFIWEIKEENTGQYRRFRGGEIFSLRYSCPQLLTDSVELTVTPEGLNKTSRRIVIRRQNLSIAHSETPVCDGREVVYTIKGFNDLAQPQDVKVEWTEEDNLWYVPELGIIEPDSLRTFEASGSGYAIVKAVVKHPVVDGKGELVLADGEIQYQSECVYLENKDVLVVPLHTSSEPIATEIDRIYIAKRSPYYYRINAIYDLSSHLSWDTDNYCVLNITSWDDWENNTPYSIDIFAIAPQDTIEVVLHTIGNNCNPTARNKQIFRFTDPDSPNMRIKSDREGNVHVGDTIQYDIVDNADIMDPFIVNWTCSDNLSIIRDSEYDMKAKATGTGRATVNFSLLHREAGINSCKQIISNSAVNIVPVLEGESDVCCGTPYTYTYILPYVAEEDITLSVNVKYLDNTTLSTGTLFIPAGSQSAEFTVVWSSDGDTLDNSIFVDGEELKKVTYYCGIYSALHYTIESIPKVAELGTIGGIHYWYIPANERGDIYLKVLNGLAAHYEWMVNGEIQESFNSVNIHYEYAENEDEEITIKVIPVYSPYYPCPGITNIIIKRKNNLKTGPKTSVYTIMGTLVHSSESDVNIDELNLSNGIYIIERINDEGVIVREKINIDK